MRQEVSCSLRESCIEYHLEPIGVDQSPKGQWTGPRAGSRHVVYLHPRSTGLRNMSVAHFCKFSSSFALKISLILFDKIRE